MTFITQDKTNWKYILIVATLTIVVSGGISAYFWMAKKEPNMPEIELSRSETLDKGEKSKSYRITISKKYGSLEPEYESLRLYLEDLLGLSRESISHIVYDTRDGSPYDSVLDFSYYALFKNESVELKSSYENESIIAQVARIDERLIPYIEDSDYCETDADCVVRTDFCKYGAFNHYHSFHDIWGCVVITETEFECNVPDPGEECFSTECDVEYIGVECISNQCFAKNRTENCPSQ